mgnify:CR=1 FL=1
MKKWIWILFIPSALFAQQKVIDINGIKLKGIISNYEGVNLPDEYVANAQNVLFDEDLGPSKREGYTRDNLVSFGSQSVSGLWQFVGSGDVEYLLAITSNTFRYSIGASTYTTIFSTITSGFQVEGVSAFNRFWFTSSTQSGYIDSDLKNRDTVTDFPEGRFIAKHVNRIWVAGVNDNRSILYGSKFLNGDNWTLGGNAGDPVQFTIGLNDGDQITGIFPYAVRGESVLIIFKRRSMWVLKGKTQNDFELVNLNTSIGCIQGRSIREKQGKLFWLSHRGLEKMENGQIVPFFSHPIKDITDKIIAGYDVTTIKNFSDTDSGNFNNGISTYIEIQSNAITILSPSTKTIDTWNGGAFSDIKLAGQATGDTKETIAQSFRSIIQTNAILIKTPLCAGGDGNFIHFTLRESNVNFSTKPSVVALTTVTRVSGQTGGDFSDCISPNHPSHSSKFNSIDFTNISILANTTYWFAMKSTATNIAGGLVSFLLSQSSQTDPYKHGFYYTHRVNVAPETEEFQDKDLYFQVFFGSGIFESDVKDLGKNVKRYNIFDSNRSLNDGIINFFVRSDPDSSIIRGKSWVAQQLGSTPSIDTARYFQWKAEFYITSDTHTPTIQDVSLDWIDNETKQNVASWVYNDRYLLACSTNSLADSSNETVLIVDKFDNFTKDNGINANSFAESFEKLYFGTSISTGGQSGLVFRFHDSFNDRSTSIDAFIETKDYCGENCDGEKFFDRLYVKTKNDKASGGVLTSQFQFDKDESYSSLGDVLLTEKTGLIVSKVLFPFGAGGVRGRTVRFKFGNNQADHDFRFYGAKVYYNEFPVD